MRRVLINILLLLLSPILLFAQKYPEGEDKFFYESGLTFAGLNYYEIEYPLEEDEEPDNECDKQLINYLLTRAHSNFEAVDKHFSNSEFLIPSLFYKGRIECLLGNDSAAFATFHKLFALPLISDEVVSRTVSRKQPQPIENIYHAAALSMAKLCIRNKKFNDAIFYLESTNDIYKRYQYKDPIIRGNEYATKRILRAQCYFELRRYDIVIELLLPYAFDKEIFGQTNPTEILCKSLNNLYTKSQLSDAFANGYLNIKKIDFKWQCTFEVREGYSMPFLDTTIIFEPRVENKLIRFEDENEYYKWVKNTAFYKMLFNSY